ncbi:Gfo/Idh/MocA family oxidoreductase [Paracoccus sp. CPCC 101403]|uniref:Gfo/Idh/MocA family oxidoreductase n=1 Tax=Paracoccus broussonetiae TaxID=3075834 RepID=A0ABU3EI77_9RHOB|nr:Gfo/Idh/MocA family oxidoreductase [Paracoccus sp. CPCC 101403]MDT1063938.1 Gfo/Idh/MocA family oxidoreductase [Paracoccus sp. CPCC 101403]
MTNGMKTGIIGLGHRIAAILPFLRDNCPDLDLVAVADPGPGHDARLAEADPAHRYADPVEMLARHRFDLLLIGSPNHLHMQHLRLALASDTPHIFAEKPVVISLDETLELARLLRAHDGVGRIAVGMVLRYSALYRALRAAAAQIGEVMSIEASEHIAPYHGSFFMRDWRRDSTLSGGFMLEKCCHDLDLYQGAAGARAARVASFGGRKKYLPAQRPAGRPDYLKVMSPRWGGTADAYSGQGDLIDYQTALVEYQNGASLAFHTNLNTPDEFRRFAVIGTQGMAEGDFIRNYFKLTRAEDGAVLIDDRDIGTAGDMKHHYGADAAMARDLAAHWRGELPSLPLTVTDALEAGATALAMDRARTEGRVFDLAPFWARFDEALTGRAAA